ncbi:MAG: arabinose transporter [Desulfobulbaceae bacterium]|nr:arabinose transporter [Desulfobulbaceae bacterium]
MRKETIHLLSNTAALFISYLAVAMPLPVVSVHVTNELGFANSLGGLAVGLAFLATIFTRGPSGRLADRQGGKRCMMIGLLLYALASGVCCASVSFALDSAWSFALLLAGRLLLGVGESLTMIGMLSWNIALLGPQRSGLVFSLVGASVYGAIGAGGPLGLWLFEHFGFAKMMLVCCPLPLVGWLVIRAAPDSPPVVVAAAHGSAVSFFRVLAAIWRQGAIVGSQGVGFAALGAFISLYFSSKGWPHAGFSLTFFGVGFVLMRLACGHLPDKFGGGPVAIGSLGVAAIGQLLLWLAPMPEIAQLGAFCAGVGCSLVYPAMGVEVVRITRPELRGAALGGFAIFQDVAYGLTAPLAGLFADRFGYPVVFFLGLIAALLGLLLAVTATRRRRPSI